MEKFSKNKDLISLREAAHISGYSPDYIGQLIRSGKLPGTQVYLNVAWMTTRDAIEAYVRGERKGVRSSILDRTSSLEWVSAAYTRVVWTAIVILSMVLVVLVSLVAVSLDHKATKQYAPHVDHAL